jgi:hypothetical protein
VWARDAPLPTLTVARESETADGPMCDASAAGAAAPLSAVSCGRARACCLPALLACRLCLSVPLACSAGLFRLPARDRLLMGRLCSFVHVETRSAAPLPRLRQWLAGDGGDYRLRERRHVHSVNDNDGFCAGASSAYDDKESFLGADDDADGAKLEIESIPEWSAAVRRNVLQRNINIADDRRMGSAPP